MINIQPSVPIVGIYKISSPKGKTYIGQSIDIQKRFYLYKILSCKSQIKLYNSLKKYGPENHKFEEIEYCPIEQLNERERYWQDYYNVIGIKGLNCKLTKTDDKSGKSSNETKHKISKSKTGYKHSPETLIKFKKPKSPSHIDTMKRPIIQYDLNMNFIKEWESILKAKTETKIKGISNNVTGRAKTAGGYIWKYKD
jgi:group I intron endonuclease